MWSVLQPDWSRPLKTSQVDIEPSVLQEHDMQLKRLILRENVQTANCTAQKSLFVCLFFFFPPIKHAGWSLVACDVPMATPCDLFPRSNHNLLLPNRWAKRHSTCPTLPRTASQIRSPLLLCPNALVSNIISTLSQRTCVHRGGFSFSFFLYKSETIFSIFTRNQGTM